MILVNISKTCIFILHHSIQHYEASDYTFYNEIDQPIQYILKSSRQNQSYQNFSPDICGWRFS